MADNNNNPGNKGPAGAPIKAKDKLQSGGANVTQIPGGCLTDGCKVKPVKAGFCMEHFNWFKEGLVTREGKKPTDFEKKFFDYQRRTQKPKAA